MKSRCKDLLKEDVDPERLKSLSEFQLLIIEKALKFPSLKRMTYSTSKLQRLNESLDLKTSCLSF